MPSYKKKTSILTDEEMVKVRNLLEEMEADKAFNTRSSYSVDSEKYPDNLIPFVDKHMTYLTSRRNVDLEHYISNLRLITRIRNT